MDTDIRFITLLIFLCIVGCNTAEVPQVTPTATVPSPSSTSSLTATQTSVIATWSPAPDAFATEFSITSTAIVGAILATQKPSTYDTYLSPDGQWQTEVVIYDCIKVSANPNADPNAYEQLLLTDLSIGQETPIDAQLQNCGGLGAAGLEGLFWSPNSRYFYYTHSREGSPDGCGGFWQKPIHRLEIETLEIEPLGGGPLSPDGTKLTTWQGQELIIWDVNEGNEIGRVSSEVVNPELGPGAIVWAPDSQALVYLQAESYCPLSGQSAIVHLDLSAMEQTVLLESESPTFGSARWEEVEELILFDEEGKRWIYTFSTGDLELLP